jgi:hypothetical protein
MSAAVTHGRICTMSAAVTHGRTATSVAARRAPPPKKHGERPNLRPRTADLEKP